MGTSRHRSSQAGTCCVGCGLTGSRLAAGGLDQLCGARHRATLEEVGGLLCIGRPPSQCGIADAALALTNLSCAMLTCKPASGVQYAGSRAERLHHLMSGQQSRVMAGGAQGLQLAWVLALCTSLADPLHVAHNLLTLVVGALDCRVLSSFWIATLLWHLFMSSADSNPS
jgi:hypothetical protein